MTKRSSLPRGVAVVGAGMCKFGAFPEKSSRDLFVEAFQELVKSVDKGFDPLSIETVYVGNYSGELFEGQGHLAPLMVDAIGLTPDRLFEWKMPAPAVGLLSARESWR